MNVTSKSRKKHEFGVSGSRSSVTRRKVAVDEGVQSSELEILQQRCRNKQDGSLATETLLDTTFEDWGRQRGAFEKCISVPEQRGVNRFTSVDETRGASSDMTKLQVLIARGDRSQKHESRTSQNIIKQVSSELSQSSNSLGITESYFTSRQGQDRFEFEDSIDTMDDMDKPTRLSPRKGKRLSRRKVMKGLMAMSDSIEDAKERESLRNEVAALMALEKSERGHTVRSLKLKSSLKGSNATASNYNRRKKGLNKENDPFISFSSTTNAFRNSGQKEKEADSVLEDLLWTEFVANRKGLVSHQPKSSVSTNINTLDKLSSRSSSLMMGSSVSVSTMNSRRAGSVCSEPHNMSSLYQGHSSKNNRSSLHRSVSKFPKLKIQHLSTTIEEFPEATLMSPRQSQVLDRQQPYKLNSTPAPLTRARSWWRRSGSSSSKTVRSSPVRRNNNVLSAWSESSERRVRLPTSISFRNGEKRYYQSNRQEVVWDSNSFHSTYSGNTFGFGTTNSEI